MRRHVADPEAWRENLDEVLLVAADAVPIYLHAGPGRLAVPVAELDERNKREWRRRNPKEKWEGAQMNVFRESQGQSRQQKDRLTWVCRQGVKHAFKKAGEAGRLIGVMLSSIFIVPCSQHVRLEDITPERTWARTHSVREGGQLKERKKGEPIP